MQINVEVFTFKTTNDYMMRIVRVKLRYFKLLTSRAHQIRIQSLLSNYFGALYLDGENLFLAKFSRRSLARETTFAFYTHRHACSVYDCFLLLFCSGNSKSSVPYSFSFIHRSSSVVVISPSSSS